MNIVLRWVVVGVSVTICILTFLVGQPLVYSILTVLDSLATGMGFSGTEWTATRDTLRYAASYGPLVVALAIIVWGFLSSMRREALGYEYG